jgi:hypothetical protein
MQVNSDHMGVKSNEKIIEKNLKDRTSRLRYKNLVNAGQFKPYESKIK